MEHIEDIYSGCEPVGRAEPSRSHTVRFCFGTSHAHCTLMCLLSEAFIKAQLLAESGNLEPYHISIIWQLELDFKRKEENAESAYEIMKFFVNNMLPPKNGAIISIYKTKPSFIQTSWKLTQVWPFKKRWTGGGGFVTVHKSEALMSKTRYPGILLAEETIIPEIEEKYDTKTIDYTMSIKTIYDLLLSTDKHYSYSGGTAYTSAMTGTPTEIWTHDPNDTHTPWGYMGISPNTITQYNKGIYQGPIEYIKIYGGKND